MSAPDEPVTVFEETAQAISDPTEAFQSETLATNLAPIDENEDQDKELLPAEITPERVANLSTTNDTAPAVTQAVAIQASDPEIEDLGWSEDPKAPVPLLRGLNNEQLWLLIRRFDQQVYHVQVVQDYPQGRLDLNISDAEQFSPSKLQATLERVYISVGIPIVAAAKHVGRLRSWNERKRTTYFSVVYFSAWLLDLIIPLTLLMLITLTLSTRVRQQLFPAAPLSAVSATTGTIQDLSVAPPPTDDDKESNGILAHPDSKDSLTGAPEAYNGQAVEREASNFVTELGALTVRSVTGQGSHPSGAEAMGSQPSSSTKKPTSPAEMVASVNIFHRSTAAKDQAKNDNTKATVQATVWTKASPVMHMLSDFADTFERIGNALLPTSPFSRRRSRMRLAAIFLLILPLSLFVSARVVWKGVMFAIGVGMFGQPIFDYIDIRRIIEWLDLHYPHWRTALQLRNCILRGVPTNAQLTLTMLRIGEANKAPLPPPPPASCSPPLPDSDDESGQEGEKKKKWSKGSTLAAIVKGTTKATMGSALGINRLQASLGSEKSKARVGAVQPPGPSSESTAESKKAHKYPSCRDGPIYFEARYRGKKGSLVIITSGTTPAVGFELFPSSKLTLRSEGEARRPLWSVAIEDIRDLRKIGGLGWRSKFLVGWSMGEEVVDGIEITDVLGNEYAVTAMRRMNEAFNRLVAMGNQSWESL